MRTAEARAFARSAGLTATVQHGLAWLVVGNALGVMIAVLLLLPQLNVWLGEWTYGRWMMVHMNTALFGWCSLPLVGFLFRVYDADSGATAEWCRPVVWLWSAGLVVGSISWLQGHSSGKLFLDWSGYARFFFPLALLGLWVLLAIAFATSRMGARGSRIGWTARAAGLLVLLAVPFAIYFASSPNLYPAVNPATGGPTAVSQLESTLGMVLIVLALPFGLAPRKRKHGKVIEICWTTFGVEALLCVLLGRADVSHYAPAQYVSLASVLVWFVLAPAYYKRFEWHASTRRWRNAFLFWWAGLVITGWLMFLPGMLDRLKFTDALVGHSLAAVAGFLSAFILFVMVQLLGDSDAWVLNRTWSFYAWNLGVLAYVVVMMTAGWIEGADPAFTIAPGTARNAMYVIRLLTGVSMLAASVEWLAAAFSLRAVESAVGVESRGVKAA